MHLARLSVVKRKGSCSLCRDPLDYFVKILGKQCEPVSGKSSAGCTLVSYDPQVLHCGQYCGCWLQQSGSILDQFHKKSFLISDLHKKKNIVFITSTSSSGATTNIEMQSSHHLLLIWKSGHKHIIWTWYDMQIIDVNVVHLWSVQMWTYQWFTGRLTF